MSKETIHYTCGHTSVVNLCGNTKDRARRAKWMGETRVCPECEQAAFEAKRFAENEAAAKANTAAGLVALSGTPKQIAWAETIRAKALAAEANQSELTPSIINDIKREIGAKIAQAHPEEVNAIRAELSAKSTDGTVSPSAIGMAIITNHAASIDLAIAALQDEVMAARVDLESNADAKWWIDFRSWNEEFVGRRLAEQCSKWATMIATGAK